jgi:hypothetical protein
MRVTALYHDPANRTYKGDWVVVLAFPDNLGFERHRFQNEDTALLFAATHTDGRTR